MCWVLDLYCVCVGLACLIVGLMFNSWLVCLLICDLCWWLVSVRLGLGGLACLLGGLILVRASCVIYSVCSLLINFILF